MEYDGDNCGPAHRNNPFSIVCWIWPLWRKLEVPEQAQFQLKATKRPIPKPTFCMDSKMVDQKAIMQTAVWQPWRAELQCGSDRSSEFQTIRTFIWMQRANLFLIFSGLKRWSPWWCTLAGGVFNRRIIVGHKRIWNNYSTNRRSESNNVDQCVAKILSKDIILDKITNSVSIDLKCII